MNDVKVTSGSYVAAPDEVLIERSFADFNHVHAGDAVEVVLADGSTSS